MTMGNALDATSEKVSLTVSGPGNGYHSLFFAGDRLVAEWYDFGENAPYESVNQLVLGADAQRRLLGDAAAATGSAALHALAHRFDSWWSLKRECDAAGIAYEKVTDFEV